MRLLVEQDPEAEVIILAPRDSAPAAGMMSNVILPTCDAEAGRFPPESGGPMAGKPHVMICGTSLWGRSPPRRIIP